MVSSPSSHAQASSLRAHSPTLAFPPLSPERAPMMVPSGRRTVAAVVSGAVGRAGGATRSGASGTPGDRAASPGASTTEGADPGTLAVWGTSTRRPSAWTTAGVTRPAGRRAGQ